MLTKNVCERELEKDMKIANATNSSSMFCCKGEQTYGIIVEGNYESKKAFMFIF